MVISTGNVHPVDSSVITDDVEVNTKLTHIASNYKHYCRIVHFFYQELKPVQLIL